MSSLATDQNEHNETIRVYSNDRIKTLEEENRRLRADNRRLRDDIIDLTDGRLWINIPTVGGYGENLAELLEDDYADDAPVLAYARAALTRAMENGVMEEVLDVDGVLNDLDERILPEIREALYNDNYFPITDDDPTQAQRLGQPNAPPLTRTLSVEEQKEELQNLDMTDMERESGGVFKMFANDSGTAISITSDNRVGINTDVASSDTSVVLHVNGKIATSGTVDYSDDRVKHNETNITDALSTIGKLSVKHYIKTGRKIYDANHNFKVDENGNPLDESGNLLKFGEDYTIETGIIAQDIQGIPELKFTVCGEEYIEDTETTYKIDENGKFVLDENDNKIIEGVKTVKKPMILAVDYNSIHCTHIQATKELHELVKKLQEENKTLTTEIATLKQQIQTLFTLHQS
jgi:hypothetical protein